MSRTQYTQEVAQEICERIASGDNLNIISQEDGYPVQSTIYKWLDESEDFSEMYARARARRADSRSDRVDEYKRQCLMGKIAPDIARVVIDTEKWQAGKESPRYADKSSVDVNHKGTVGIVQADLSGLCGLLAQLTTSRADTALPGDVPDRSLLPAPVRAE